MTIRQSLASTTLALGLLALGSSEAQAGIIHYDFSVTVDTTTASLAGQTFSGNFSFDDASVPNLGFNGEDLFALLSFSFDFDGNLFTLADLYYGDAALQGSTLLGLDAGAATFSFLPDDGLFPASFAYDFGNGDAGTGSFTAALSPVTAPEPSLAWLVGSGLLALGVARRRATGRHC